MTAHKWMIDLWGGCRTEINHHIFLSTHPDNDENKKEPFLCVHVPTNDYNASFVKWDDLPHHRTSSILIDLQKIFDLSVRLTNTCQSKQLRGKSQVGRNVEQLVLVFDGAWECVHYVGLWMMMCSEEKENRVLFSTSAQPFEMHMTTAY